MANPSVMGFPPIDSYFPNHENTGLEQSDRSVSFAQRQCKVNKDFRNEMNHSASGKQGGNIIRRYCCLSNNCIGRFSSMTDLKKHYVNIHSSKEVEEGLLDLSPIQLSYSKESSDEPARKLLGIDRLNIERVDVTEIINEVARGFDIDISDLDEGLKTIPVVLLEPSSKKEGPEPSSLVALHTAGARQGKFGFPVDFTPTTIPTNYIKVLEGVTKKYYDTIDNPSLPFQSYREAEMSHKNVFRAGHPYSRISSIDRTKKYLTIEQKRELKRLVTNKRVQDFGLNFGLSGTQWSSTNVAELVRQTFQVACSEKYANHLVYSQGMNFRDLNKTPDIQYCGQFFEHSMSVPQGLRDKASIYW